MYSMPLFVWETKEKKSMDVFVNAQNYQKQLPTGETGGWGQDLRKAFFSLNTMVLLNHWLLSIILSLYTFASFYMLWSNIFVSN